MPDEMNGAAPDEDAAEEIKPYIHVDFAGELSANITLNMEHVSAAMIWAAAAMLHKYATDLWDENQMRQIMEAQQAEAAAQAAASKGSPIVPVHGSLRSLDHLPKQKRN